MESQTRSCNECNFFCYDLQTNKNYTIGEIISQDDCSIRVCARNYSNALIIEKPIPESNVDGYWSIWSEWSVCGILSFNQRQKFRICQEAKCNGKICEKGDGDLNFLSDLNKLEETVTEPCLPSNFF